MPFNVVAVRGERLSSLVRQPCLDALALVSGAELHVIDAMPVPADLSAVDVLVDLRDVPPSQRARGTIYLHLGERPGFAFFDEIATGSRTVSMELRRRNEDGTHAGLRRGRIAFGPTYAHTLRFAGTLAAEWLFAHAENVRTGHAIAASAVAETPDASPVGALERARFFVRCAQCVLRSAFTFFFVDAAWDVGIANAGARQLVAGEIGPVRWLHPDRSRPFYADPFYVSDGNREYILCETVSHGSRTGNITSIAFERNSTNYAEQTALSTGSHLSYPFVLTRDGVTYVVPESNATKSVDAYVMQPDGTLRFFRRLLDVDACDSTIFRYGERWWLFCTRRSGGSNVRLYAFVADDPLGPWHAHRANPVKADICSSRPAGPVFTCDGQTYRPAQDCGSGYGAAVVLHRIVRLDEDAYEEREVARFEPRAEMPHGLHTLTVAKGFTIVDGKRDYISLATAFWQARRLLGRFRRRSTRLRDVVPPNPWRRLMLAIPFSPSAERACNVPDAHAPALPLGAYYIEWSSGTAVMGEDWDILPRDRSGVLQTMRGEQYHPIDIAQFALHSHARCLRTDDAQALRAFRAQARWLRDNQRPRRGIDGCYVFAFPWEKYGARTGWISAMAQGEAVSVLLRAEQLFPGEGFAAAAYAAAQPFRFDVREGGVVARTRDGDAFFEECAVTPSAHILNGHIFALWGVWELALTRDELWLKELVDEGIATVRRNLSHYDTGYWSAYSLLKTRSGKRHLATLKYHAFHISQLRVLAGMTGDAFFADAADRWQKYADRWSARMRVASVTAAGAVERTLFGGDGVPQGARSIV